MASTVLFTLERGGYPEVVVRGWVRYYRGDECVLALGGDEAFPTRSLLKPVQFLAGLGGSFAEGVPERWIPALGSPSGTPAQTRCLERWFGHEEFLAHRDALRLKPSMPFDSDAAGVARSEGSAPRKEWNSCYVKHLAIVEACQRHGWDIATYCGKNHPYHERVRGIIGHALGRDAESIEFVVDGCRLPTPVLTLDDMARLYRHLLSEKAPAAVAVIQAMQRHPDWIGGPGRLDTEILRRNPRAIAKEGADGLLAVAKAPRHRDEPIESVVVKLEGGYRKCHLATALDLLPPEFELEFPRPVYEGQRLVFGDASA